MPTNKKRYTFSYKGKRWYVSASNEREAGEKIAEKKRQIDNDTPTSNTPFRKWAILCIEQFMVDKSENSREKNEYWMSHAIIPYFGNMPLASITPMALQTFINQYSGTSKTQIGYVFNNLRFIFRQAVLHDILQKDPTTNLVKPRGTSKKRRALTPEERSAVIAVAKTNRRYYIYLLMIFCGCRPTEAAECVGKDIVKKEHNGKEYFLLHIKGTKTSCSDRFVPIPDELLTLIRSTPKNEYIAVTDDGNKVAGNESRRWRHFTYHVNLKMGAKTYRNAIIEPVFCSDITPYYLRHEYCTELARRGVDIRVAQKLMGHASIRMTADIYTNLDIDDLMDKVYDLF